MEIQNNKKYGPICNDCLENKDYGKISTLFGEWTKCRRPTCVFCKEEEATDLLEKEIKL